MAVGGVVMLALGPGCRGRNKDTMAKAIAKARTHGFYLGLDRNCE
jgi:hypothetical protein